MAVSPHPDDDDDDDRGYVIDVSAIFSSHRYPRKQDMELSWFVRCLQFSHLVAALITLNET